MPIDFAVVAVVVGVADFDRSSRGGIVKSTANIANGSGFGFGFGSASLLPPLPLRLRLRLRLSSEPTIVVVTGNGPSVLFETLWLL